MERFNFRRGTTALVAYFLVALSLLSCTRSQKDITPSAAYAPFVNAYTGGVISQTSGIRVELTQDQPMVDLNNELKENPFSFSPSLKGKTYWTSNNTLEFVPEEGQLKPGTFYEASFRLGEFVKVDEALEAFNFSFRVQERNFTLHTHPIDVAASRPDRATVSGEVWFSDVAKKEQVEKMLQASGAKGEKHRVVITATDHPSRFAYSIKDLPRTDREYALTLQIDGKTVGIERTQTEKVMIPAKGEFKYLSAQRIEQPENGVQIVFSDPISETQDLKGLIEIPEVMSTVFQVKDNKVNVYFEAGQLQKMTLKINAGVRNNENKPLSNAQTISFSEISLKPQIEMPLQGAILPDSKNLVIPFRAVSLHAVDLNVIRIFESNILTFMQNNSLEGSSELRRSGRLVYQNTLWLGKDKSKDLRKWEDYSIDLSGLIKQEPGAIYRVVLSFKQAYSAYPCGEEESRKEMQFADDSSGELTKVTSGGVSEKDNAEWDVPQAYYYYSGGSEMDWTQYRWEERDNPCHPTYYMTSDRAAACNILASDIGMIVKRNSLHKLWIAVNNLMDTQPVEKAKVTVYNFQLQTIGTAETDGEGFALIEPKGVPFIVVAESEQQKAYVKVIDGEEESVSRFDVGGKEIQKGLKGLIYGERGVWRPGDTLHIAFILEDREKRIPDKHPVSLEVFNPRGQFHTKLIATNGTNGCYTFHVPTGANAPTGLWNAYVKVGGTAFHKSLRVETIKPNRLKIHLKLPAGALKASESEIPATLSAAWLTGATASQLKVKTEMTLSKVNTQFKEYARYLFNNPATEFTTVRTDLFEGTLDGSGNANLRLKLPASGNAPGMLNAQITSRVFEPGGDASIHTLTVPYSPFTSYVGINLNQPEGKEIETDKEHTFDIVTLNTEGQLVNRSNLEYKIYRIGWSWWWENRDESFGSYINGSSIVPVASGTLSTVGGKSSFKFRVNYPDWGRYLVYVTDRQSGHATGGTVLVDWPEWRGRSDKADPSSIKMLSFSLDKESYEIGETVTAILPPITGGRALVSLENGSTVLQREWIEVSNKKDTKYTFKATAEMAPNVYLHISLLQPHAQTSNDLPIRLYGVMPVLVTDKQTVLQPQIRMPEVLRPEKAFQVTVSEKSGRPMTYTLAIVDDGLLDLTGFKTPDPWNEFYAREALGIRTWDMYDQVLGASAGKFGSMFSTGGDEMLKPADSKANRFKPVVKFIGPFTIGKRESKTHELTLPMYVGSVRTMVVAGQNGAYGSAEKTTPVRTPLMLLSTLPRVMSAQEEILVPVNVFAMENNVKSVTVSIAASGGGIQVAGSGSQSLTFTQTGDRLVFFRLKTGHQTGKATVRLTASGGGQQTKEHIEIEIRNPNPIVTLQESQWIEEGKEVRLNYALNSMSQDNRIRLAVSRIPSVDVSRRFDFLYNYQHACTEQLASKALPLLFAGQFKEIDATETEQIKKSVQEAIRQLYARQLPNGGFVYWPGNATADEWITSYAGMFLTLAQEKGYAVNNNVLNKWKRFQRAAAQNWRTPQQESAWTIWQSDLQQSFRLYVLALAGVPEHGPMNRMKESATLSLQARWRLAAAYALTGKTKAASELIFKIQTTVVPYSSSNQVYGSSDRDEAMILETLVWMNRKQDALNQAKVVSRNLLGEQHFSTQSTAFSLMAMARLAEQLAGMLNFTWEANGKAQPAVKSAKALFETSIAAVPGKGTLTVRNRGKGALNAVVTTRTRLLNDTLPVFANQLRVEVRYVAMDGSAIDIDRLPQGTDFVAVVNVANISGTTDYTHLALTHLIPSGWEIYNDRTNASPDAGTTSTGKYTYQDIRDDRVLTYFDLKQGESKTFPIRLQATYAGSFVLPAIQCEAMYEAAVQGRTKAGRCEVGK